MRGHVDEVSRAGDKAAELVGARLGAVGIIRRLDRMDVNVVSARMVGVIPYRFF